MWIEKSNQNSVSNNEKLDPLTCEIATSMVEFLRYSTFVSTKELEKLKTCNNLNELDKYLKLEREILKIIFTQDKNLKKLNNFEIDITIEQKNFDLLVLLEKYVSIDFLRRNAKSFDEENIKSIKIYIRKDEKKRFFIENIKVI